MATFRNTRKMVACSVFGIPKDMSDIVLPTYEHVMQYYALIKHQMKPTAATKEPSVSDISEKVAQNIELIWLKASIPVVSHTRILQMIRSYHDKFMKLMKNIKRKNSKVVAHTFRNDAKSRLFDISACKCIFEVCSCDKSRKVPPAEQAFLHDQRTLRLMAIGGVDKLASKKIAMKLLRKAKALHTVVRGNTPQMRKPGRPSSTVDIQNLRDSDHDGGTIYDDDTIAGQIDDCSGNKTTTKASELPDIWSPVTPSSNEKSMSRRKLPTLARTCDRYGISDRSAAAIATAVLEDYDIVTANDSFNVIDPSKIRRERKRKRIEIKPSEESKIVSGIYFDGRKDKTMNNNKEGSKFYRRIVTEEHISLIQEPGSLYLGHVTPNGSTAKDIKNSITSFIADSKIDVEHFVAIGCDGTNVNTGRAGGVISLLEKEYGKPLQWLICMLHANELPLRHLLQHLDGSTSGPRAFSGPIGKALANCQTLPVVSFDRIEVVLPIVTLKTLSTDQQYMWEICEAISKGECSQALSKRNPGALNHSRWITTANRVLRLYVACGEPSINLKHLVTYIVKVYAPLWFSIKMHPSCKDGARHLFRSIQLSRYLSQDLLDIIDPVLQRNGYFGHPENVLLSMISDERQNIRELGLRRILKARLEKSSILREFRVPKLQFDASEYFDLIDWKNTGVTEPPLTMNVTEADIRLFVATHGDSTVDFDRYPCHTQSVERCVKIVTEASLALCGQSGRDGFIRSRLEARSIMPVFNTKSEYRVSQ